MYIFWKQKMEALHSYRPSWFLIWKMRTDIRMNTMLLWQSTFLLTKT
jgi:hypothetical protein